jgi:hypothetical protein
MTTSLDLTIEDFERQLAQTYEAMCRVFESAFGVGVEDRFTEMEEHIGTQYGADAANHMLVLQGIIDRDTEEFLDEDGNVLTDLSGTSVELCKEAVTLFLAKIKPASVYNENMLYGVSHCWFNLNLAGGCLAASQHSEALHFLAGANKALGQAQMLLVLRERGRERARKGGKQRHAPMQEEKEPAQTIFRQFIAGKGLSNAQAASKLQSEFGIRYHYGGVTRLVSKARKEMESDS